MSWRKIVKKSRPPAQEQKRDIPYEIPSQRLGPQLASEIARLFDNARIPSVVWDWIERSPLTEARNHMEIEFVVPDHLLVEAKKVVVSVGFRPCPARSECHMFDELPFKPLPTIHFHHITRVDEVISLRRKFALATRLQLKLEAPRPNDPDFMLSNDPRLAGSPSVFAPLPDGLYPFRLLTPVRFAEALIVQASWDVDVEREEVIQGYLLRLRYLKEHGQGPSGGPLVEEDFHEYLRPFWGALDEVEFPWMLAHARRLNFQLNKTAYRLPTQEEIEEKYARRRWSAMRKGENVEQRGDCIC